MRRWTGIVAIVALVSAALVAGSGPAGAAPAPAVTATPSTALADGHTVTVNPNKGLADGQTVTVAGTGFSEDPIGGNWALTTCTAEFLSGPFTLQRAIQVCAVGDPPFVFVPPTADGNITTPYTLHQEFSTLSGPVKCGQAPNDCVVLLAQLTSSDFQGGTAPISFGKPVPTLADCIREFLGDKVHHPLRRWFRLFVCIFTALTQKPR